MLTVSEVADELGISRVRVRQLIASGRLYADKYGRDWMVPPAALHRLVQDWPRKPGRPKK